MNKSIFLYFMGASAFAGSNPSSDLAEALAGKKCLDTGANPGAYAISLGNFSSQCSALGNVPVVVSEWVKKPNGITLEEVCPTINPFVNPHYVIACYPMDGVSAALNAGNCTRLTTGGPGITVDGLDPLKFAHCKAPRFVPGTLVICPKSSESEALRSYRCLPASEPAHDGSSSASSSSAAFALGVSALTSAGIFLGSRLKGECKKRSSTSAVIFAGLRKKGKCKKRSSTGSSASEALASTDLLGIQLLTREDAMRNPINGGASGYGSFSVI